VGTAIGEVVGSRTGPAAPSRPRPGPRAAAPRTS